MAAAETKADIRANREPYPGTCKLSGMVDIDLIVKSLRANGHKVEDVHHVPSNAGEYELIIDGAVLNLEGARRVLELDAAK